MRTGLDLIPKYSYFLSGNYFPKKNLQTLVLDKRDLWARFFANSQREEVRGIRRLGEIFPMASPPPILALLVHS